MSTHHANRRRGFSMIELLIAMVIIGVLASVAMPAWHDHVIRTRRNEAQATLFRLMLQQERYFTQNGSYLAFSASSTGFEQRQFQWWSGLTALRSGYEIEGRPCDGALIEECVQLVATPGTALVDVDFRDRECNQLTLTSTGARTASGRRSDCWR